MPGRRDEEIATALKSAYEAGRLAVWFDRPLPQPGPGDRRILTEQDQAPESPPEWHH